MKEAKNEHKAVCEAVREVMGEPEAALPLHVPVFGDTAEQYVVECVRTGWVSSVGKFVDRFEEDLAAYTGVKRAIAVMNGTSALHAALQLSGVRQGDEILLPSFSFIATANAVSYCGAVPHFVDISPDTLGVDPGRIGSYLEEIADVRADGCVSRLTGRPIRALIGMHAFGHPFDVDGVREVCRRYGLKFIEDAAESIGSFYKGQHTGGLSDVGIVSFNGNKTISTGGGGAILTNDEEFANRAKHLTTTGKVPHPYRTMHDVVAYNYRMTNVSAALGCSQLEDLEGLVEEKRAIAKRYQEAFADFHELEVFCEPDGCRSNYWLNCLILSEKLSPEMEKMIETFHQDKIFVRPVWEPLHTLPMYSDCPHMDLSVTLAMAKRIINLPSTPKLSKKQAEEMDGIIYE